MPAGFRFAVKLPKAITHEHRLRDCDDLLERFAGEVGGLDAKRGPILMQLPPSLAFEETIARAFFRAANDVLGGTIVCEPRHASWFDEDADALLDEQRIARVAADPPTIPAGSQPGGWRGLSYFRLHGAPRTYWSDYPVEVINQHAAATIELAGQGRDVWTIFDNTAAGCAPANALALLRD